jgi:hypothetical protein
LKRPKKSAAAWFSFRHLGILTGIFNYFVSALKVNVVAAVQVPMRIQNQPISGFSPQYAAGCRHIHGLLNLNCFHHLLSCTSIKHKSDISLGLYISTHDPLDTERHKNRIREASNVPKEVPEESLKILLQLERRSDWKQRLAHIYFPEGVMYAEGNYRTGVTCLLFSGMQNEDGTKRRFGSPNRFRVEPNTPELAANGRFEA